MAKNTKYRIHTRDDFVKPLNKKSFYHGTSGKYVFSILKKGLMPKPQQTNYTDIAHDDKVFITLNPERSLVHASITAYETNSFPIILKLKIPDVSQIVLDYDVAIELYGTEHHQTEVLGYQDIYNIATSGHPFEMSKASITNMVPKGEVEQVRDKSSLNTKLGVFGYTGRIPFRFIESVLVNPDNITTYILRDEFDLDGQYATAGLEEYSVKEFSELIEETREEIESEFDDEYDD